jgi:serine/threonine protein kinase
MENIKICNKYLVEKQIGAGKFGIVYRGTCIRSQENVAIKTESKSSDLHILKHEANTINHLYYKGCRNIPTVLYYGVTDKHIVLVMPYYNMSLDKYKQSGKPLPDKQLQLIMYSCIEILEHIHKCFIIHRDIKPHNFMLNTNGELFLIDFGMAIPFVDDNNNHIAENAVPRDYITGTPKYISHNVHMGIEPSRRDDLISLGYMYLYLKNGFLPWDDTHLTPEVLTQYNCNTTYPEHHILFCKNAARRHLKMRDNIGDYLKLHGDIAIIRYLEYCYRIAFSTKPIYDELRKLFSTN